LADSLMRFLVWPPPIWRSEKDSPAVDSESLRGCPWRKKPNCWRAITRNASAQVKPVSEFLQTHEPGKLRHRPNPLLPSLSQTLPTSFTPLRERKRRRPCTVKKIYGHQHTSRSIEDSAQQVLSSPAIVPINQTKNHPHGRLRC
jgi:hypothetical protein